MAQSLLGQRHPLAVIAQQRETLQPRGAFLPFEQALVRGGSGRLRSSRLEFLQINLGKMCNQTCKHCHVDAGPDRTEIMTWEIMEHCLRAVDAADIKTADLTGGAPEMNPEFRRLVVALRERGVRVIDRCNLTILTVGRFRDLPEFLAEQGVEIVASLPYYLGRNTDAQRGEGVFEASIQSLQHLNALGYGQEGSGLTLNLVYNPTGAFLAPRQASVEPEYRRELHRRHGIVFNNLYVLANMPINRFLEYLLRTGQYEEYLGRLIAAYNPAAVEGLMCRNTLSVGWDGGLYDCDFNQQLEMPVAAGHPRHIAEFAEDLLADRPIVTGLHCYGCTAGQGSSCGGAVVGSEA